MKVVVNEEFVEICNQIIQQRKTPEEWAEIESSTMFQSERYSGGFDADEMAFCFSFYASQGEYWFQLKLKEIKDIVNGTLREISLVPSES